MSTDMFFSGWATLGRTVVVGVCAYAALVTLLRVTGKRSLSKMSAFDLVVTVALGSTLASVITSKDVTLAQGVVALVLLIGLQYAVAWTSIRSDRVRRLTRADPTLLAYQGRRLDHALRSQRITREELDAAVRDAGLGTLDDVGAVVLETDGSFSVIPRDALAPGTPSSLIPVSEHEPG
jgi:uncharacterized membrane protein YcaP (DUF421 family)